MNNLRCVRNIDGKQLYDNDGRALIISIGLPDGNAHDIILHTKKTLDEALSQSNGICTIIEVNHPTFRYPDRKLLKLFDYMSGNYNILDNPIIFINASKLMTTGINMAKKILPSRMSNIITYENAKSLSKHLPNHSLLERWGGNIIFDFQVNDMKTYDNKREMFTTSCLINGKKFGNKSKRWKPKQFAMLDDTLIYGSNNEIEEYIDLSTIVETIVSGENITLVTPLRPYTFGGDIVNVLKNISWKNNVSNET